MSYTIEQLEVPEGSYWKDVDEISREEWDRLFEQADYGNDVASVSYWYAYGSYEGEGEATVTLTDGSVLEMNLGHCSCYGPLDQQPLTYPDPDSPCAVAARKRAADELYDGS